MARYQQMTAQQQIKIIERKLKQLWEKCADPEQKKSIVIDDIVRITTYMVKQFVDDKDGYLFETPIVEHLQILLALARDMTDDFVEELESITRLMCEMCKKVEPSNSLLNRWLAIWHQWLYYIPSSQKNGVFSNHELARCCGEFLVEARSSHMQIQMLHIICSYFDGLDYHEKSFALYSAFRDVIKLKFHAVEEFEKIFQGNLGNSFQEKHCLLNYINNCIPNRLVYSMPFVGFKPKFFAAKVYMDDPGWMYLNMLTSAIEFWFPTKEHPEKVTIEEQNLQSIQLIESTGNTIIVVKLNLNSSPLKYEVNGKASNKTIGQCFDVELKNKHSYVQLITMFDKMLPKIHCERIKCEVRQDFDKMDAETFCTKVELKHNAFEEYTEIASVELSSVPHSVLTKSSTFTQFGAMPLKRQVSFFEKKLFHKNSSSPIGDSTIYEFNEIDYEPAVKKKRPQPKKKQKPKTWPLIELPQMPRREKNYTFHVKVPVGSSAKQTTQHPLDPKIIANIAKINQAEMLQPSQKMTPKSVHKFTRPELPPKVVNGQKQPKKLFNKISTDDEDENCMEMAFRKPTPDSLRFSRNRLTYNQKTVQNKKNRLLQKDSDAVPKYSKLSLDLNWDCDINGNKTMASCIQNHHRVIKKELEDILSSANRALIALS